MMFITLKDETGVANLVIWPERCAKQRRTIVASATLGVAICSSLTCNIDTVKLKTGDFR